MTNLDLSATHPDLAAQSKKLGEQNDVILESEVDSWRLDLRILPVLYWLQQYRKAPPSRAFARQAHRRSLIHRRPQPRAASMPQAVSVVSEPYRPLTIQGAARPPRRLRRFAVAPG